MPELGLYISLFFFRNDVGVADSDCNGDGTALKIMLMKMMMTIMTE